MKKNTFERYSNIAINSIKRKILGIDLSYNIKHLTFEVTNLCNSKCEMCHIWANKPSKAEMSIDEIKTIFSDNSLKNLEDVILTGGEAFLRDDIEEIVDIIWSINKKVNITLSTNGLLHEKITTVAENLAKKGVPISYGISLDGIGEEHDKRRRVENNFNIIDKKLIPGLKKISINFPGMVKIGIGHCLDEYGLSTFNGVKSYCELNEIGFMTQVIEDFDYYLPEVKHERTTGEWHKLHEIKIGFEGENRLMKKDIYSKNKSNYIRLLKRLPPSVHHYRLINVLRGKESKYECSSMRNFFLLRYDGAITPCLRFCNKEIGNVKRNTVTSVLNGQSRVDAVNEILNCEGCLNTWCTDWSMEENAFPFKYEIVRWLTKKLT